VTRSPLSRSKGQWSRSPGRFTQHRVNASGSCSGEHGNVLPVRRYCYVSACSAARGASAPTEGGGGGAYRCGRPPTACLDRKTEKLKEVFLKSSGVSSKQMGQRRQTTVCILSHRRTMQLQSPTWENMNVATILNPSLQRIMSNNVSHVNSKNFISKYHIVKVHTATCLDHWKMTGWMLLRKNYSTSCVASLMLTRFDQYCRDVTCTNMQVQVHVQIQAREYQVRVRVQTLPSAIMAHQIYQHVVSMILQAKLDKCAILSYYILWC